MYSKNIQQSYWQYLNQRPLKYIQPYQPSLLIPTSSVSSNHITNLANYRNYIKQEMKFLGTQAQRDQAQMILIELRIQEANAFFHQQFDYLKDQLKNVSTKYGKIVQQRDALQEKNLNNVKLLKEKFLQEEKLREKQLQNKTNNQTIQKEISELKNQDGNGAIQKTEQQIENKRKKLVQSTSIIQKNEQNRKTLKQDSQDIRRKTQQILGICQQTRQSIEIRQNYIVTLKNEKEKQEKELLYVKNKIKHSQKNMQQMKAKNQLLRKNLQKEQNLTDILQKQQDDLNHQLNVSLKDLEIQKRGREKEEEKICKAINKMEQAEGDVNRLKQHLKQLMESNYTYQQLLKKFHQRDLVLTTALLDRLQSQENYKEKMSNKLSNTRLQRNFYKQNISDRKYNNNELLERKKPCLYQNIEPYLTKSPLSIGTNAKFNSIPQQNCLKKDRTNKQNERQDQLEFDKRSEQRQSLLLKSRSTNLLLQKPQNTFQGKDTISKFQKTASSDYQNNLRQQMPKQVADIINKYKNKQNLSVFDELILPHKSKENYSTYSKYDSYTSKRPLILNQLMNYRPSASNWFHE